MAIQRKISQMPDCRWNLLDEELISVRGADGKARPIDLPTLFERLGKSEEFEFTALRPHQFHAWHAFLVQLAAIALHTNRVEGPARPAQVWREYLRDLTDGEDEAWCLFTEDPSKPAFLQSPIPDVDLSVYKNRLDTPDLLDVLVTSKNHDVKRARIHQPRTEHWIFALVTLQTTEGFLGRGKYGVARMNSGFGNRPAISYSPSQGWAARFRRDLVVILQERMKICKAYGYPSDGGHSLLWLLGWDGEESIPLGDLDPFFVEICRRIRCFREGDRICFRDRPTKGRRIAAGEQCGDVGDSWTPIHRDSGKSLTVSATGFGYRLTRELLLGNEYTSAPAGNLRKEDGAEPYFLASTLVRGNGRTEGLQRRAIRIPQRVRRLLTTNEGRGRLAGASSERIEATKDVQRKVLRPALCRLIQDGAERLDLRDERIGHWMKDHDESVDQIFFQRLWEDADRDPSAAKTGWERTVLDLARNVLQSSIESAPIPASRRYRAVARAEQLFEACSRKHFPDAFE